MPNNITNTDAWFPEDAVIKMENKSTGSVTTFTTEVTNFSDGGGNKDTESVAHFGGAFLVIKKPQEDFEVEFEVDVIDGTWMEVISGDVVADSGFQMVRSGGTQDDYKVKIEWKATGTNTEAYKIVYYNAVGVSFEKDNAADDRLTGTITFNVAPTDANGSPNRLELETNDYDDSGVGSGIAGSYGSWEAYYDTLHGFGIGSML